MSLKDLCIHRSELSSFQLVALPIHVVGLQSTSVVCHIRIFRSCFEQWPKFVMNLSQRKPRQDKLGQLVLITVLTMHSCYGKNILTLSAQAASSPSHYMVLSTITRGLVSHGHNVTLVSNDLKATVGFPNGTYSHTLFVKASYNQEDVEQLIEQIHGIAFDTTSGIRGVFNTFSEIFRLNYRSCLDVWEDTKTLHNLKKSHFDIVMVFPHSPCDVLIATYLETPFFVVVPSIRIPFFYEGLIGMPYPSSYVPFDVLGKFTDEMTFWQRTQNFFTPFLYDIVDYFANSYFYEIQKEFHVHPEMSIRELYSKASLWLAHVNDGNDFARPRTPNMIPVGGLVSRPAKPLSQELEDFVQSSGEHGIIVFTLGSGVSRIASEETASVFASVFKKLPQRVLWRHKGKIPGNLGENTKIKDWLPQNDLLGHPKTRLLIYHGGSNGVLESITHGVPMVIIPLVGDQYAHAVRVQSKGMGLMLDKSNISEESLTFVIQEVLNNPRYKERVQHYSDIHHDLPMTPLERAVYWIEHVMKFGDQHLRPRSADMSFIELYMIDVAVFLLFVLFIVLYIDFLVLKICYKCCCTPKSKLKTKNE
ncbi:UDP-glucuronosyltransferase 1-2 [Holothuria leucospilota]|uniref:UDP-glucuronosyltransferase 1-2 n=1 Tax=Holothuria leucospilota TaxID=206669 RepID=A0A9Q1BNR5_HOLLE|nr:UDP-glucuronosyltransferase 1-2 [Holothuria leucospilota]